MTDPRFDGLARALAQPMPRRRAVRMMATGLIAASFPALRPKLAAAGCPDTGCGSFCCGPTHKCCSSVNNNCCSAEEVCCDNAPGDSGGVCCPPGHQCCNAGTSRNFCCAGDSVCCTGPFFTDCCAPGEQCEDGFCREAPRCPDGRPRCGDECCEKDQECIDGKCVPKCPPKRTRCRDQCCPAGERCVKGKCRQCPEDRKACGKKCCGKGEDCCFDETRKICCDTKRRSCCSVGETDTAEGTITCCPSDAPCAKQINQGEGGITPDSPTVCCPKKRLIPSGSDKCCPPGYASMGGKLVVTACPGDQTSDLCCREDLVCGSGENITCCTTPGFDPACTQMCCNGVCRSINVDRNNCGACGNVCPADQRCENGSCVPA